MDGLYDFSITLTGRVVVPFDKVGSQHIARNLERIPLGFRQGFNAKVEQLGTFLHMNWRISVLQGQTPNSANDNLKAWASGSSPVYGFVEPPVWQGYELPTLVGGEWLAADPEAQEYALKSQLAFVGARRMQPQTAPVGVFQ